MSGVDVVVVGGGLSGLLCGVALRERGIDVMVVEGADRPGGVARGWERRGHRLEPAASTLLLPNPGLSPLLAAAGVETLPAPGAGLRYIFTRNRLVPVPAGPAAAVAPVLPWRAKLELLLEPFRPVLDSEDPSLEEFCRARFGPRAGSFVAWVMSAGVFAGDPAVLSARAAFPPMVALADADGSVIRGALRRRGGGIRPTTHVPMGGMDRLVERLAGYLDDRLRTSFPVKRVAPSSDGWTVDGPESISARRVVMATGADETARLIPGLADLLAGFRAAPVVVVFLGGATERFRVPDGFGYLVGPDHAGITLGVVFESNLDPTRAPAGRTLVKAIVGGARRPEVVEWDDDRIVDTVGSELARALGRDVEVDLAEVVRHRKGIPQYPIGHLDRLRRLEDRLAELPGLHLTGWSYRGVGVSQLAADAQRLAQVLAG